MTPQHRRVDWRGDATRHKFAAVETGWLAAVHLYTTDGSQPVELRTPDDQESGLLVLSGTLDLEANSGSWISRGTRAEPYDGRPFALFLPPRTAVRASGGAGEILVVSARQPALAPAPADPPEANPLLPLAGSNKAFDSRSGTWQPIESFPESPEALPPRRIARANVGGVPTEQVFPIDYKARGLTLIEAVLAPGQQLSVPDRAVAGYPEDWAIYFSTEGVLSATAAGATDEWRGDGALFGSGDVVLSGDGGRTYLAVAAAGTKPS